MPSQLVLPLPQRSALGREDFIVTPVNAQAVAFVDSWPHWPVAAAAIHGPSGSGKSHLVAIWREASEATIVSADDVDEEFVLELAPGTPLAVEDIDADAATPERDRALFALLEHASRGAPILLTGHEASVAWDCTLPDLKSRFSALLALPLWAPDDALLAGLARKLFSDRQLIVPDAVIERMLQALERSPGAVRDFVDRADARALSEARPINLALIRDMLS